MNAFSPYSMPTNTQALPYSAPTETAATPAIIEDSTTVIREITSTLTPNAAATSGRSAIARVARP